MPLSISYRSDLVQVGTHFEDGEPIIRQSFYVIAEAENGQRWAHRHSFCSNDPQESDIRCQILSDRIADFVAAGGTLDPLLWDEIDPAYGSAAYQGLDAESYFRNREIAEARDAGEITDYEANRLMMA